MTRMSPTAVTRDNGANPAVGSSLATWAVAARFSEVVAGGTERIGKSEPTPQWRSEPWAERAMVSALAVQAVEYGLATPLDLRGMTEGFLRRATEPTGRINSAVRARQ